jgi:hypothetical protein
MSKERRYQDHEIREILDLAIGQEDGPAPTLPAADGLTLFQLQDVGREVGVPPERISQAVAVFEGRGEFVPRGTALGLPTSVGRVVQLPRSPSEREWELIIAELRTTFGVKGEVTSQGSLREWSHGTLHAFLEPTETGHRLRLTDSSLAVAGIPLGGFIVALALLVFVVLLGKEDPGFRFAVPAFFGLIGGGLVAGSALSLPKWAREQERRMEHIGRHAVSLLTGPGSTDQSGA